MSEICLLCKERKVYYIKSHLTPAGITERTYGERDSEHIFTIDPQESKVEEYYGRNHPQQETTEVKDAPNSKKGIFCKECEENFGKYESVVQNKLNEILESIGNGAVINTTLLGIKFVNIEIHPNILITFFGSIVWRQCIQQEIEGMENPLSFEQFENLRKFTIQHISIPIKEHEQTEILGYPKMSIFTTYNTKGTTAYVNPHPFDTNPLVFFIGPTVLLYWLNDLPTSTFEDKTKISKKLLDNSLTLCKSRLAIVSSEEWENIHYVVAKELSRQYLGL